MTINLKQVCCQFTTDFNKLSQAMRTHPDVHELVDNKSVARCQQTLLQPWVTLWLFTRYIFCSRNSLPANSSLKAGGSETKCRSDKLRRHQLITFSILVLFARGATFCMRLKKLNCFQLCGCTILAENDAPRRKIPPSGRQALAESKMAGIGHLKIWCFFSFV